MNINIAQRIAWILILFSLTAAQEKQVEVVDPYTNVYIAPTPNSKLLGVVNKGEKCTVLSDINDWYRIKVPGITGGWLRKSAVKLLEPSTPPPPLPPPPPPPVEPVSVPTPPVSSDSPVAVVESISVPVVSAEEVSDKPVSAIDTSYSQRAQTTTPKAFSSRKEQKRSEQKPEPVKKESRIKNWFTQQNFLQSPPVVHQFDDDDPGIKYFQVTYSMTKVLLYLSPDAPLLGMAKKGENLPLVGEGESWCKVVYKDTIGWIERKYGNIIDAPGSILSLNLRGIGFLAAAVALFFIVIFIPILIIRKRKAAARDSDKGLAIKKNVFIIAKTPKTIQYSLTDTTTTLEKCFLEAGFQISSIKDLPSLRNRLSELIPEVVVVDFRFDRTILQTLERIFSQIPGSDKILFIVYNVADITGMQPGRILPAMTFLGVTFSDREIFKVVTPHLLAVNSQNIQKSIQSSALEGNIADGNLIEVLQFIEIGSKTGCILIETEKPFALIYFLNGRIIYAATSNGIMGRDAIYAVLNLKEGKFRFLVDRKPKSSNVNLSTLEVLMEWTKAVDEAHGH
jgi:hypothetical protein